MHEVRSHRMSKGVWGGFVVLLALVAALGLARAAAAVCCSGQGAVCRDGHQTGPFDCCGKGPCNIFCCNCDGGCREATAQGCVPACDYGTGVCRSGCDLCIGPGCFTELCDQACVREGETCKAGCPRSAATAARALEFNDVSVWYRFDALDADKNGLLTRKEIEDGFDKVRMCMPSKDALPEVFAKSDANSDGNLSPEEAGFPPRPKAN